MYCFPNYAPKIHRIRIHNNEIQILQTITVKRPNGTPASGIINPTGLGSTAAELASTDTVQDCANFLIKTTAKDTFGIDPEGIVVDKDGNFWLCEEGGATIWKLNSNGVLIKDILHMQTLMVFNRSMYKLILFLNIAKTTEVLKVYP